MFLLEPRPTPYDLKFPLFGFPVRVTPWFWLVALLLGGGGGFQDGTKLLIWILVVFLSILIHEMGHALAYRQFGTSCRIILYHMGGLAVADTYQSPWQIAGRRRDPRQDIMISLAGPLMQLGAAIMVAAVVMALVHARTLPLQRLGDIYGVTYHVTGSEHLAIFVFDFLTVSVFWALLNLLPVFPLDGGQIARNLFVMFGGGNAISNSLTLSMITGIGAAFYGFSHGQQYLGILFAMLAYSSFQALQQYGGGFR